MGQFGENFGDNFDLTGSGTPTATGQVCDLGDVKA